MPLLPSFLDLLDVWQASGGSLVAGMDAGRHRPLADHAHRALIAFVHGQPPWSPNDVQELSVEPQDCSPVPEPLLELWR